MKNITLSDEEYDVLMGALATARRTLKEETYGYVNRAPAQLTPAQAETAKFYGEVRTLYTRLDALDV